VTAADEQLVAELAEALDNTAAGLWMGQSGPGWGHVVAAALLPVVLADRRRAVAEALREAANKWQWSDWIGLPGRLEQRLASAQYVTVWLRDRARADAVEADQ
jgi:3-hydroxyacyl-CoA dehydrogenase